MFDSFEPQSKCSVFLGNEEVTTQIAPSQQLFAIHANLLCKWPFSTTYPMRNELCRRSLLPEAVAFGLSSCLSSPFGSKNHDLQIHCFTTVAKVSFLGIPEITNEK